MVAAAPVGTGSRNPTNPRKIACTPPRREHPKNPHRPPLIPSEDNASSAGVRRPRTKEISSRYRASYSASSSSTSSSYSAAICPGSASSSGPSTSPALPTAQKRFHSVDRDRPSSCRSLDGPAQAEPSAAARDLYTTTGRPSVSFEGESFYQIGRAKAASPGTPAVERRPADGACSASAKGSDLLQNSSPAFENHHRWPASRARPLNPLMRSLSCSSVTEEPILATVRLLQQSAVCDESTRRVSFEEADLSASTDTDTDSVSSGSNSGTPEFGMVSRAKVIPHGIIVPARFPQERNSRLSLYCEPCSPLSSQDSRFVVPKLGSARKVLECPLSSPRPASSSLHPHVRPPSPNKVAASPSRSMASPLRSRSIVSSSVSTLDAGSNAPSIISFSAEVRRTKKGENRIEEAHLLRLLDNRHLQWRRINARVNSAMLLQKLTVEKNLYNAWITTSELQDSITAKRIQLLFMTQNLKLTSILRGQKAYLEEWSLVEGDYSTSLSGATDALNASILRLPLVNGAKANILELKDAVGSSVAMIQGIGATICSLSSKVAGSDNLVGDIAKLAQQERVLLDQSRDLLSAVAAMHVRQCSLQGHLVQIRRKARQIQV